MMRRIQVTGRLQALFAVLLLIGVFAAPEKAFAWWNSDWSYRTEVALDGGATGGALPGDAGRVPLLLRLHDGNFKFADAKDDGTDLRFIAADDKTPLKYHIETFDPVLGIGLVWVDLPDVKAGVSSKFWMYYGNPKADSGVDVHGTYDSNQVLVYHLGDKTAPAKDWTAYGNNALNTVPSDSGSLIGFGVRLDGKSAIMVAANPSLNVAAGGAMTFAAWVKPEGTDPQVLFARHEGGASLIVGIDNNTPYVSVTPDGGAPGRATSDAPLSPGQWHQIALTADQQVTLYVDGVPHATLAQALPAFTGGISIGGDVAAPAVGADVSTGLVGGLDEVEISKIARPAGYIKALVASQGPDPKLLKFGQDEQNSSWGGGYFVVILKSVTTDGWVVIGVLMVMAVISWYVMADRARYIGKVGRANQAFLKAYRDAGRDPIRFDQILRGGGGNAKIDRKDSALLKQSPLFRLFSVGIDELRDRFSTPGSRDIVDMELTGPSIAAIRASIDAALVVETRALNNMMVLLTIAISGGPFIGLLGTVVGVMITFAAIAVAGDVNVNSIAPGIAAALVATCAGLFVAIPALFGYNYFLIRVRDEGASLQTFIDQLVTRLAEISHDHAAARKLAAE